MNKTEFLLRAKLSGAFKYKTMLKIAETLAVESEINLESLSQLYNVIPENLARRCDKLLFDDSLGYRTNQLKSQCQVLSFFDELYPQKLREIYRPPLLLFYRGDINLLASQCVGIVGARQHTNYSREILRGLIPNLVKQNKTTVSGLAAGVDSIVHELTLKHNGPTIAVIGNGLNHYYPKQNAGLQREIEKTGLLISEYLPDTSPARFRFPERNRIIAGLSDDLIVTEARIKSGSLITANVALQENRNVYAVPGPITSELSAGTNELILAGATPVVSFEWE